MDFSNQIFGQRRNLLSIFTVGALHAHVYVELEITRFSRTSYQHSFIQPW